MDVAQNSGPCTFSVGQLPQTRAIFLYAGPPPVRVLYDQSPFSPKSDTPGSTCIIYGECLICGNQI